MKTVIKSVLFLILICMLSGCLVVAPAKGSPGNSANAPGQIKKATGSQSAKPYAPGQQKKKN